MQSARTAGQVVVGRDDDALLALDRLQEDGDGGLVDGVGAAASASPYGTTRNPGVYGPKPRRASGSVENDTIVVVRPWKLPSATMIVARSAGTPLTS